MCHEICTLTCFPAEVGVLDNLITLTKVQGPVPERRHNSIPGINVPYSRDNFIP